MTKREPSPPPACGLGPTGQRVRRALPVIAPPAAFRVALRVRLCDAPPGPRPVPRPLP